MASKLMSRFVGEARRVPPLLVSAISVLLSLQLQSHAQNVNEQVTVPIPDKGGQVVNVKAYGAVGDGVRTIRPRSSRL